MIITKKSFNKEGEVDAKTCHEIGVKLAEEMWGDRFEVVVSTHLNTKHYHNHFVINSVSFKDGKRYYDKRSTYAELRSLSDSICEEYSLSIVNNKKIPKYKTNYENYHKYNMEHNNYYTNTKNDLDRAIGMAYTYTDFENILKAMNYNIQYRYDKLTIRKEPYKKNIRVQRCFGDEYTTERIKERIKLEKIPRVPFLDIKTKDNIRSKIKEKPKKVKKSNIVSKKKKQVAKETASKSKTVAKKSKELAEKSI